MATATFCSAVHRPTGVFEHQPMFLDTLPTHLELLARVSLYVWGVGRTQCEGQHMHDRLRVESKPRGSVTHVHVP
eukprot:364692-Chlamydomonas_euryale.AAC.6